MDGASHPRRIAEDLIDIGAVSFSADHPFKWASGIFSPIYCDNRMTLGYPAVRRRIRDAFVSVLRSEGLQPDVLAGTATAGIPHAAWLAEALDLPMVYVRSKPKEHGRGSQIEGPLEAGQTVIVIEDLISTGGSSITVVEALRRAGARVLAVCGIFSYGLDEATRAFAVADVALHTLTDFHHLLQVAKERGSIDEAEATSVAEWRADPRKWSQRRRETTESP